MISKLKNNEFMNQDIVISSLGMVAARKYFIAEAYY